MASKCKCCQFPTREYLQHISLLLVKLPLVFGETSLACWQKSTLLLIVLNLIWPVLDCGSSGVLEIM